MKHHPPVGAVAQARRLRKNMTQAERRLWRLLRESFGDFHFRRQVPIGHFIADFASHRAGLVIEVDGGQHNAEADARRTQIMQEEGYRVLCFWNHEVLGSPDGVWTVIDAALRGDHPTPPPTHQGEGDMKSAPPHRGEG